MSGRDYAASIIAGCAQDASPTWRWPAAVPGLGPACGPGPLSRCWHCGRAAWTRFGLAFDYRRPPSREPRWPTEQVPINGDQPGSIPMCLRCAVELAGALGTA